MEPGELLTRWTVRLSLACYVAALVLGRRRSARLLWTLGLALFVIHVAAAFGQFHGWSHRDAYDSTARQTGDATGLYWGGGLWANYLFALVWGLHAALWWAGRALPRRAEYAVQGFMGFIAFNAAVVFASGPTRWLGLGCCVLLVLMSRKRQRRSSEDRR